MFLICYGTRPELIKLFPIINKLKNRKIPYKTMFTGQHEDLIKELDKLSLTRILAFNKLFDLDNSKSFEVAVPQP